MRTNSFYHPIHEGSQYERTDPDYVDKQLHRIVSDYLSCPKEWRSTFLHGLSKIEIDHLKKRGVLK